jgi:hypothetical protein
MAMRNMHRGFFLRPLMPPLLLSDCSIEGRGDAADPVAANIPRRSMPRTAGSTWHSRSPDGQYNINSKPALPGL